MLPQDPKTVCYRRWGGSVVLACIWLYVASGPALAIETARELVMQGDTLLQQARAEPNGKRREQRLSQAVDTYAKAYNLGLRQAKIHALIGAAQGYLLLRQAPSRFPFLWSASPLDRAEKSLQHVLALAPDNAAANLLMGITLWRRARASDASAEFRRRSEHYLRQAEQAGIKVGWSTSTPVPGRFTVGDTILALQYADARGTGLIDDLVFVYKRPSETLCYGVVVNAGSAYPMVSDPVTGGMAATTTLTALDVRPQASGRPLITLTWEAEGHSNYMGFQWNGEAFEAVPATAPPR